MMKIMSRALVGAAAASMAFAPIAAQANTRASDNAPVYSSNTVAQPGTARAADGEEIAGTPGILLVLFAAAAAIGGIVILAGSDNDPNQSPGT